MSGAVTDNGAPPAIGRAWRTVSGGFSRTRIHAAMIVIVVTLTAGGCVTTSAPTGDAAPKPAASEVQPLSGSTNVIHVVPIEGIAGPLQLVLADAVAASLRDSERPAVLSAQANTQGPTVVGKVTRVRPRGSVVWISTTWSLLAPFGTPVAERNREIVVDKSYWDRNSVEVVNLVVGDAMPAVAAMVQDHVGPLHIAQAVVEEVPLLNVGAVDPTPATPPEPALIRDAVQPSMPAAEAPSQSAIPADQDTPTALELSVPVAPTPADRPPIVLNPNATRQPPPTEPLVGAPTPSLTGEALPDRIENLTESVESEIAELNDKPTTVETRVAEKNEPTSATPAVLETMGQRPTPGLAVQPKPAGRVAASPGDTPVVWGRPSFLIRKISGAPGDGNRALSSALRSALHGKDLTVTDDPRQAGYEVVGNVDIGPPVNGRQRARISWIVNTISGEEVGKAIQENVIAAGSLNRSWGKVAEIVSAAAANGIQQLFEAPRPKFTPVGAVPEFPKVPALPRVPGRALPPPPS